MYKRQDIVKAIAKIQSQSTTNPSSISQAAAVEALSGTQDFIKERANSFQERRDFVVNALNAIDGIECLNPDGAFYVFPSCKGLMGKKDPNGNEIKSDTDFVQSLLENSGIAVVQGSAFGLEGFFRISYATSMDNLKKAMDKISSFCKSLSSSPSSQSLIISGVSLRFMLFDTRSLRACHTKVRIWWGTLLMKSFGSIPISLIPIPFAAAIPILQFSWTW